jgi:hypothetical protein
MIMTGLALGDLHGIIKEINLQEIDRMQWERWLHHGQSMSYEKFWGKPYGGRN